MIPFKVLHDLILIKKIDETHHNGLILTTGTKKAKVMAVGQGSGKYPAPDEVKEGDTVYYSSSHVAPWQYEGIDYLLTRECDILGIYDGE